MNSKLNSDSSVSVSENFSDESRTQDIFLLRGDSKRVTRVTFENYRNYNKNKGAKQLAWFNQDNQHQFFCTKSGGDPINLIGPALTKVTEADLEHSVLPNELHEAGFKPETGYLLDLRLIQINRLRPTLNEGGIVAVELDHPLENKLEQPPEASTDIHIPVEQLKKIPDNENLYIISWDNPLKARSIDNVYAYKLSYLSAEYLDSLDYGELENKAKGLELKELEHCKHVLTDYYNNAGVQVGTINPLDTGLPHLVGLACYVANLNSFIK